jgi:hypothetical protein
MAVDIKVLDKTYTSKLGFAQTQKYPFWYYLSVTLVLVGIRAGPNCTVFFCGLNFAGLRSLFYSKHL